MNIQGLDNFIRTLNNASNSFDEEASKRLNNISQKLVAKVKLKNLTYPLLHQLRSLALH